MKIKIEPDGSGARAMQYQSDFLEIVAPETPVELHQTGIPLEDARLNMEIRGTVPSGESFGKMDIRANTGLQKFKTDNTNSTAAHSAEMLTDQHHIVRGLFSFLQRARVRILSFLNFLKLNLVHNGFSSRADSVGA